MAKKNNKKQVKTNKVVNKATTPAEEKVEEVKETETPKADSKAATQNKNAKPEKNTNKDKKDAKKADDKTKKRWFRDFKAELKKVTWPTGKELFNNTAVVLMVVIVVSVLIFLLDLAFGALTKFEVKQIEKYRNDTTNSIVENTIDENNTTGDVNTETGTTEIDLTQENN